MQKMKIITGLIISSLLLVAFQNCGKPESHVGEVELLSLGPTIDYAYTKPTPVYFEAQLIRKNSDAQWINYELMLFATPSDGSRKIIDYTVNVLAADGTRLCPEQAGQFASGQTLVTEGCLAPLNRKVHSVKFRVRAAQATEWEERITLIK